MEFSNSGVYFKPVPWSMLKFPPDPEPAVIPPPSGHPTLSHPFVIPTNVYNAMLSANVPITIALTYATTVTLLNRYNAKRGNKPWAISKTRPFFVFVVAHNIFLAVYSAWTFLGMFNAIKASVPSPQGETGLVGFVDGLCKVHGPRGIGSAATFNTSTGAWGIANRALQLGADGIPNQTDVGRMWNEGLAFYGWLFYLSKFYEVFDTLIILAKGKRSSTLQTYHHAGAMMCMWAGIRFMAPPIWMFAFVNSLIHALMYTYYTLTALSVKVPISVKRTLTTIQIAQFLVGTTFAFAHLFVAYKIPVSVPYIYSLADLTSIPAGVSSTVSSAATAIASAGVGSWVKKVALRAAGVEGPAENVENDMGQTFGIDAIHAAQYLKSREEIRYRDEFQSIRCIDTSGQVFAILLNCFYLTPLTVLFVRFFIKSYSRRSSRKSTSIGHASNEARKDATHGIGRQITEEIGRMHGSDTPTTSPSDDMQEKLTHLKDLDKAIESAKAGVDSTLEDIKDKASS